MEDAFKVGARRGKFRLTRRNLIFLTVVLAAGVALVAGLYTLSGDSDGGAGGSVRVITGVQFPYPAGWVEQPLTDADKSAGLVLKLERGDPESNFLARTVVARLDPAFDINRLAEDTARALNSEIDGFHLASNNVTTVSSLQAVQLTYTQKGEGDAKFETLMTIIPLPNQTFYLTMRAPESEYAKVEAEGVQLMNTFAAYVNPVNAP